MERVLKGYEPENLYSFFEDLTRIPRGSGNEKEASDYVCTLAEKLGLWYKQDELFNVIVKKPGSGGLEDAEPVILTGHLDVVCEKNNDVVHDFTKDPVDMYVEGDWLKTRGTTLGADNGTAVAIMLALLSEEGGKLPPLECLFTTQEETGMAGAQGFDYSLLRGHTLINLDSGRTKNPTVSCAGAEFDYATFAFKRADAAGTPLTVALTGLVGGHSGSRIHLGRQNSIRLLARILGMAREKVAFRLASFDGGSKANAIPREAVAELVTEEPEALTKEIERITEDLRAELIEDDKGLAVTVKEGGRADAFSEADTDSLLFFLNAVPNGALSFVPTDPGLVESSSNLGVIRTEGDKVVVTVMPRSSLESRMDEIAFRLDALARRAGAELVHTRRHTGWAWAPKSHLRDVYSAVYERLRGEKPSYEGIHAGLECGVMSGRIPGMDAIAIGSRAVGAHTPEEMMDIPDLARTLELVKQVLAAL